MTREARWTQAFLATVALGCASVALLNVVVNPLGYYPSSFLRPLAWSSREAKVDLLAKRRPTAIVLGSSRAMKVPPAIVEKRTGERAFNASVDSARVEDWTALHGFATSRGPLRQIVLGIDIEAFHDHAPPDPRLGATPELRPYLPRAMRFDWYAEAARSLLSYSQAVDSLRSLALARSGYPASPHAFDEDGFLHYPVIERAMADGTFRFDPRAQGDAYEGRFAGFRSLGPERVMLFRAFLAETTIPIRAFVTPLHDGLRARLRMTRDLDRLTRLLLDELTACARRFPHFRFVDYSDVRAFAGNPDGFIDPAHTDDDNSRRLTDALFDALP